MGGPADGAQMAKSSRRARSEFSVDDIKANNNNSSNARDGSALSKGTMDSGLGLEDESSGALPGTVTEKLPSPRGRLNNDLPLLNSGRGTPRERQTSSDILEELMTQGIIQSQAKVVRNGEAFDVLMDTPEKPLRRPPAKLEKLQTKQKKKKNLTREDIENKMKAVEERRKTKEEELKKRLRSERPMTALASISELRGGGSLTPDERQEADSTVPRETVALDASENGMTIEPTKNGTADEEGDEIDALESDNTYNNPNEEVTDTGDNSF
uniref:Stathmin domain containing 1 n=1 Tax=Xenopus tropicalis TaxID=8364 RepID=A0A6I8R2M8_XENTR|eukprot:XP_017950434.1 PREDICTED: stathmin domain-containing protein 1 isoform X2 [Xenopus tropicalis]